MPEAVLRIGTALALLVPGVGRDRDEHTRRAVAALTAATGRPDIAIRRRPSGRPRLEPPYPELGVSLSYREGLLLTGFAPDRAVGVDLEPDDTASVPDPVGLAHDHFAAREAAAVAACAPEAARALFLRLWVAKEAALKVTGRGIADGLERPDCSAVLDLLQTDCAPVRVDMGPSAPPVEIAVRRIPHPHGPAVYCALAAAIGNDELA